MSGGIRVTLGDDDGNTFGVEVPPGVEPADHIGYAMGYRDALKHMGRDAEAKTPAADVFREDDLPVWERVFSGGSAVGMNGTPYFVASSLIEKVVDARIAQLMRTVQGVTADSDTGRLLGVIAYYAENPTGPDALREAVREYIEAQGKVDELGPLEMSDHSYNEYLRARGERDMALAKVRALLGDE